MSEYGFTRASDDVLAARSELAGQVVQALRRAGLPAFREGETATADRSGAVVYVEPDAELASASVSVGWRCDPRMAAPETTGQHMQSALIKILLSAGVIATPENDNMNPDHVLVFGTMSDLPPALRPNFIPPHG
ncbi:hypothetical protein ACIG0D_16220 [Streptomyces sp. NPDC052773]|jgi:hypothetical protein|uniref:hypothetical protein n=1 Tax=Streptomyces sp. NPDC052773 TaxID=3365693 RepID=UPI0037CF827A